MKATIKMICVAAAVACMQLSVAQAQDAYDEVTEVSYVDAQQTTYAAGGCETCNTGCGDVCCDDVCDECCDDCYDCCDDCCDPCAPSGNFIFMAEALFLKYHRADGARVGFAGDESAEFDLEFSPRLSAGYLNCNGFGIRGRWWQYDHSATIVEADGGSLAVDTWTIDVELVQVLNLGSRVSLEVSGGIRFNDFEETMTDINAAPALLDVRTNQFDGYGLVLGLEANAMVTNDVSLYGRLRYAALMDDKTVSNTGFANGGSEIFPQNTILRDVVVGQLELAAGIEFARQTSMGRAFLRGGVEYQTWYDYSTSFTLVDAPTPFPGDFIEFLGGPSNVGFGGLTISAGLSR